MTRYLPRMSGIAHQDGCACGATDCAYPPDEDGDDDGDDTTRVVRGQVVSAAARHRHRPATSQDRCYSGPVREVENRAAHGNICVIDTCACGAERRTNINGMHIERGAWTPAEVRS